MLLIIWLILYPVFSMELINHQVVTEPNSTLSLFNESNNYQWQLAPVYSNKIQKKLTNLIIKENHKPLQLFKKLLGPVNMSNFIYENGTISRDNTYLLGSIGSFWINSNQLNIIGEFNQWNHGDPLVFNRQDQENNSNSYIFVKKPQDGMAFLFFCNMESVPIYYVLRLFPVEKELLQQKDNIIKSKIIDNKITSIIKKYYPLMILMFTMIIMLIVCIAFGSW